MNIIEVEALEKSFRIPSVHRDTIREHAFAFFSPRRFQELKVLREISFSVKRGEAFGIMGRNGSGKSTLLKILAGIYTPDRGRVAVSAPVTPILELGLGWNPQLTARDNLFLSGTAMGMSRKQLHQQFDEIVAFAELEQFVDQQVKFYSTGMGARLAFAIAFHAVREVLLLDEILAVGDAAFRRKCGDRCRELLQKGHTLLLVSHDLGDIKSWCERAILIEEGRVAACGTAAEVVQRYGELLAGS